MIKNSSYNNAVTYFVIGFETLISGGLFLIMKKLFADDYADSVLNASGIQIGMTLMLIYAICAATSGVVLYRRKMHTR